ncbi:hypothetical protein QE364_000498 [Nocardioides zeae]|uniref:Ig-like domain repeat protein n=2 Tax=Nocardioides zeae TaxID=1457234 RepID=A0AAJ1U6W0_9ACTN|nr:hypothetical protein [Nocardioides zeae]MDQ1104427.1 hypothetical protein [Nocardioides zeae]MDR6175882.1 hypothetical protein [Nocardioides zeae]MDR6208810.1 hypothetical protein [Nocardioides zeae]
MTDAPVTPARPVRPTRRRLALAPVLALALGGPALVAPVAAHAATASAPAVTARVAVAEASATELGSLDHRILRQSNAEGLEVLATVRGITLPAETPVHLAVAPAGTDVLTVDPTTLPGHTVIPAEDVAPDGASETGVATDTVRAEAASLRRGTTYAVFAWTDDGSVLESALDLDFDALEPGASIGIEGSRTQRYATTSRIWVAVRGSEGASVTLSGLGAPQTKRVVDELARFDVPPGVPVGRYVAELSVSADGPGDGLVASWDFQVTQGLTQTGASVQLTPTPTRAGRIKIGAWTNSSAVAPPQGRATVSIYTSAGRGVWYSGQVQLAADGTRVTGLPVLPRGSYRVDVRYSGSPLFHASSLTRTLTVR